MHFVRNAVVASILSAACLTAATQNPPVIAEEPRPLAVDTATYEIGPRDLIQVKVFGHADFSEMHRVRPDGKITIGYLGDVLAGGVTPERLSAHVKEALREWIEEPYVTVSVLDVQSKTYTLSGAIARPGPYPMPVPVKIFEAINNAGGFSSVFAKKKEVLVIGEDPSDRRVFNYEDYVNGKNLVKNVNFVLKNGDTVFVKE